MSQQAKNRHLYDQWHNYILKTTHDDEEKNKGLVASIFADEVLYFEIVQVTNGMTGVYNRCFYIKKNNPDAVYQETPLEVPYLRFTNQGLTCRRHKDEDEIHAKIKAGFERHMRPYVMFYTQIQKEVIPATTDEQTHGVHLKDNTTTTTI